jgi:flagellar L-ring protein FlgH
VLAALALGGCASKRESIIDLPMTVAATPPPALERQATGSIFHTGMGDQPLFAPNARARGLGDLIKVTISEKLIAESQASTDTARETALASKGPGSGGGTGMLSRLLDVDATASGSNSFRGNGKTDAATSFDGQLVATVINVMPNGNLLLAGERIVSLGGNQTLLRFAGLVSPKDIKPGNVVMSTDVANARLEVAGAGDVSEATSRRWIQRVLSNAFSIW